MRPRCENTVRIHESDHIFWHVGASNRGRHHPPRCSLTRETRRFPPPLSLETGLAHKRMQEAMTELITNKNYSEVERLLHVADKLMVDLIQDMGGTVVRSGLWT